MRSPVRRRVAIALVLGAIAAVTAVAPGTGVAPSGAVPAPRVPVLHWQPCEDRYECTRARVPLDYDDPAGPTISLALMRLPASDPAHRIGSLFINPGGPGGSGVDVIAAGGAFAFWSAEVRAKFDIVGFDPRGVARSTPLKCFATNDEEDAFFADLPIIFPYRPSQVAPYTSLAHRFGQRCLRRGGPILRHMSTANVARDLDLLRQAVGDPKLSYDGISYGSLIGNTYAALFPTHVRALVLDGVADPVAWATGRPPHGGSVPQWIRVGAARGAETTLDRLTTLCDTAGKAACPLAPGSKAKLERLRARLLRGPIELSPGELITYDVYDQIILEDLYATGDWAELVGIGADLYSLVFEGGPELAPASRSSLAASRVLGYDNGLEAGFSVACSDGVNPSDPSVWPRAVAHQEANGASFFAANFAYTSLPCATWPVTDHDQYLGPFNRTPSAPVLLIGNRWDPATPYAGAKTVDALLPRSRLLTVNGGGHTSWLNKSACVDQYVERYLVAGALPPVGAVCQPDLVPFTEAGPAGPSAALQAALRPVR